jgi:hypothetical protein
VRSCFAFAKILKNKTKKGRLRKDEGNVQKNGHTFMASDRFADTSAALSDNAQRNICLR